MVMSLAPELSSETPYTRAVDHVRRRKSVTAGELKRDMGFSASVVRTYLHSMQREGIIAPANDVQRHLVLKAVTYEEITEQAQETAALIMKVHEQTGIGPGTILRAAHDGTLRAMLDEFGAATVTTPDADAAADQPDAMIGRSAQSRLKTFVERIQRVEEDQAVLADDKSEIYRQAKDEGFDTKQLRKVIAFLKLDKRKLAEEEAIFDLYLSAIGESREVIE